MTRSLMWLTTPLLLPDHHGPTSRPFTPMDDPALAAPMLETLQSWIDKAPDSIAMDDNFGPTTFVELGRRIQRLAAEIQLSSRGDEPVAILLPSSAACVASVFACLAAGRICVLLDESSPAGRNLDIVSTIGAQLVLTREAAPRLDGSNFLQLRVPDRDPRLDDKVRPALRSPLGLDKAAFILCTSGSTGRPKAIVHSQRTMLHWARTTHNALHVRCDDRVLSLSSFASLGGFTSLISYPLAGACLQLFEVRIEGLSGLLDLLRTRPITILRAAPSMLRTLTQLPEARTSFAGLRIVQTYGEPLTWMDAAAISEVAPQGCFIRTTYGATECSGMSWFISASDVSDALNTPAGALMPDTQAALIGDDEASVASGEVGELVIRSRYNALGEWIDGGVRNGRLTPDPTAQDYRVYATGDLARMSPDGVFQVLGRKDRMIKINGQRLEPAEIEHVLRGDPEVDEAEVVIDVRQSPSRLIAFIVPASEAANNLEQRLKARLRARFSSYMIPRRIILVSGMPRLASGKVDGQTLLQSEGLAAFNRA